MVMYDNEYKTKKKKNWTATYTKNMAGTNESSRKTRSVVVEIKYITSQNVERSLEMKNCLSSVKANIWDLSPLPSSTTKSA